MDFLWKQLKFYVLFNQSDLRTYFKLFRKILGDLYETVNNNTWRDDLKICSKSLNDLKGFLVCVF